MENKSRWELEPSVDWLHLSLGIRLEIPRHTKYNFHRWVLKIRVLFFGLALKRKNDHRVAKAPKQVAEVTA